MAEIGMGSLPSMLPGLNGVSSPKSPMTEGPAKGGESSASFMDTLKGMMSDVNDAQKASDKAARDLVSGSQRDLHDIMMTVEKADIALRTVTAIRNKAVEAYQEIMKMPV